MCKIVSTSCHSAQLHRRRQSEVEALENAHNSYIFTLDKSKWVFELWVIEFDYENVLDGAISAFQSALQHFVNVMNSKILLLSEQNPL